MLDMDDDLKYSSTGGTEESEVAKEAQSVPTAKGASSRRAASPSQQMMMDMDDDEQQFRKGGYKVQEDNIAKLEQNLRNLGLKDADLSFSRQTTQEPTFSRQTTQDGDFSRQVSQESDVSQTRRSEAARRRASSPSMQMMMDMDNDDKYCSTGIIEEPEATKEPETVKRADVPAAKGRSSRRASSPSQQMMMDMEDDEKYSADK